MCVIPGDKMAATTGDPMQVFNAIFESSHARLDDLSRKVKAAAKASRDADREYVRERWHEIEDGRMPENMSDADVAAFVKVLDRLDEADMASKKVTP